MIPILWALTSSVAYGVSDFVGGAASRRAPAIQIVLFSYPVSAVVIAVIAFFVEGSPTPVSLIWGAAAGAVMALAMWSFYVALAAGPMSVVSPVTAVIVTVVPVSVGLVLGERPSAAALAGIAIAAAAVVLVSREPSAERSTRARIRPRVWGVTVVAGLAFALSFVFTGQIAPGTGLWPLAVARLAATILILLIALGTRRAGTPRGAAFFGAVCVGALDVVANSAMLFAFQSGTLSLGSAVIALYPAMTVALAIVVLRERVAVWQLTGLALAAASVVIISLNS